MDFFDFEYRVRYGDTDKMGISYYANYFIWFEAARTEYFRALGFPYTECEKKGFFLPVTETGARFIASSTYDDLLTLRTSVSKLRKTAVHFDYQVLGSNGRLLATGFSVHVFVNRQMKPVRMPEEIRSAVKIFSLLGKKSDCHQPGS